MRLHPIKIGVAICLAALLVIHMMIAHEYGRQMNAVGDVILTPSLQSHRRPNGVFVMKVSRAEHATKTLCTLNRFFKSTKKYPIRLFVDYEYTNKTLEALKTHVNGADLQIIVDTVSWRQLPPEINETWQTNVLENCKNFSTPEIAVCSQMKVSLAYIYMGYWRYMKMAYEPSLEQFEYFVSIDADAFLTQPIPDPFKIMSDNNLTGIFNVEIHQRGRIQTGIQEAAESIFSFEQRRSRYLDTPEYQWFNDKARWHRDGQGPPAFYGYFFGGRLDLFRNDRYKEFARQVVPYTYVYRTDEQGVMSVAWALLAENDKVWHLPYHGYDMGIYHQGFVDQSQIVKLEQRTKGEPKKYALNTLHQWSNFTLMLHTKLLTWESYVKTKGYDENDSWRTCKKACGKECNPWIDPRIT